MGKTLYILFVCGAGLGSSFAAQMAAEDVLAKYHINAKLDHVDISTARGYYYSTKFSKTICEF